MSLFGKDVKEENGERYIAEYEGENKEVAYNFAEEVRACGFKAHVRPVIKNNKVIYVTWVSEFQTRRLPSLRAQNRF